MEMTTVRVSLKSCRKIDTYNENNQSEGGKAILQWYTNYTKPETDDDVNDNMTPPKPKKRKREERETPMILALCTPIMVRAHRHVQQSSDIIL